MGGIDLKLLPSRRLRHVPVPGTLWARTASAGGLPTVGRHTPSVAELIRQRGELLVELRRNLERARQRMTETANRHRRDVEFEVGDLVWLKLQPYRQQSVAKPLSANLSWRFYGPFAVLQRIGQVAYRLQLPDGSRIHDVFHVSLLREYAAGEGAVELPKEFKGERPIVRPVQILDSQILWNDGAVVEHVLIKWSDGTESPSWEPLEAVKKHFPTLLEDKEVVNEGGVVTTTPATPSATTATASTESSTTAKSDQSTETPPKGRIEEEQEHEGELGKDATTRKLRPREALKPPQKFQNYTAK